MIVALRQGEHRLSRARDRRCSPRYSRFCCRYAPSLRRMDDGFKDPSRTLAASRSTSPRRCRVTSSSVGLPIIGASVGHRFGAPKRPRRRSGKSRSRRANARHGRWKSANTRADTPSVSAWSTSRSNAAGLPAIPSRTKDASSAVAPITEEWKEPYWKAQPVPAFKPFLCCYAANRQLGRAPKAEFVLQYMSEQQLQTKIRRALLKVEQLHALATAVITGKEAALVPANPSRGPSRAFQHGSG